MPRWIWIVIALAISTSVYFVIRYGLRPKPIPVMNPTEFQSADQIGSVVYKRLKQNLRAERAVVLGAAKDSPDDALIWEGLTRAAQVDGEKIIRFSGEQLAAENFLNSVLQSLKAGQIVLIEAPTAEVSHLVPGSITQKLEKVVGHPVLSISTARLAVAREEYDSVKLQCITATESQSAEKRLDCAGQRVARKYLKRNLAPDKIWAVMERYGLKEYLVFVYRPGPASVKE